VFLSGYGHPDSLWRARASDAMVTAIEAALGARRRRLPRSRLDEKTSSRRRMIDGSLKIQIRRLPGLNKSWALWVNSVFLCIWGKTPGSPSESTGDSSYKWAAKAGRGELPARRPRDQACRGVVGGYNRGGEWRRGAATGGER
jgi:hypothetical protein